MILYHGTSERAWKGIGRWKRRKGEIGRLYLTENMGDAGVYAYETAAMDEEEGHRPKPLVLWVDLEALEGLELEPDWGWGGVSERSTWEDSLDEAGSIAVSGDVDKYKRFFKRVPKGEWVEAETRQ